MSTKRKRRQIARVTPLTPWQTRTLRSHVRNFGPTLDANELELLFKIADDHRRLFTEVNKPKRKRAPKREGER